MTAELQGQLKDAYAKIEALENRSRSYNVRVRGLPETHTDQVHALMKELTPDISPLQLEVDRIHRALMGPRSDGLPQDVIVKPHYYRVKEKLMMATR